MSAVPPPGPRDPWASEVGEADRFGVFAFFAVMVLFGGVAYSLYLRGGRVSFDLDNLLWRDRTAVKLAQSLPGQLGEPPAPLNLKPGVAPGTAGQVQTQLGQPQVPAQPTPVARSQMYVPPVAASMGIAAAQAQPTATPQPQPTAAAGQPAIGAKYKVANTNGDGVYLRRTPNLNDKIVPWPDNTPMEYQGEQVDANGTHWARMKDPRGNVGWVPTQYLSPA